MIKSIFDKPTRDELIRRINSLNDSSAAQWGKMNAYQMIKHCAKFDELMLGKVQYKQSFVGKLFGKGALRGMLKDHGPVKRNMPTVPGFKMSGDGNVSSEAKRWASLLEEYGQFSRPSIVHPFFGEMTKEQIGQLAYKHTDHHLRQFNS